MAKVISSIERINTDHTTGEVVSTETEKVYTFPSEPPYIKLYINDLAKLYGLSSGCSKFLYELISMMDYDGIITIVKSTKNRICDRLGIKLQTAENNLQRLLKSGVIIRHERCEYIANPNLFAKGSWTCIRKLQNKWLEMSVTYENGERKIKTKVKDKRRK